MSLANNAATPRWHHLCPDDNRARRENSAKPAAGNGRRGMGDAVRFLREWLRDPGGIAAVAPSGAALAALITRGIDGTTGTVLELGAGTGVFTQRLIDGGVAQPDLTLVEQNPVFARLLRRRFPHATVLCIDAADLERSLELGDRAFGAVVCGLGLRNMEMPQVEAIIRTAFGRMRTHAALHLFTYGRRCSVPDDVLHRLDLSAERVGMTWRNMPPASVFRLTDARAGVLAEQAA